MRDDKMVPTLDHLLTKGLIKDQHNDEMTMQLKTRKYRMFRLLHVANLSHLL
jgi:hypothetical protein